MALQSRADFVGTLPQTARLWSAMPTRAASERNLHGFNNLRPEDSSLRTPQTTIKKNRT
jgi:hypothetical protein